MMNHHQAQTTMTRIHRKQWIEWGLLTTKMIGMKMTSKNKKLRKRRRIMSQVHHQDRAVAKPPKMKKVRRSRKTTKSKSAGRVVQADLTIIIRLLAQVNRNTSAFRSISFYRHVRMKSGRMMKSQMMKLLRMNQRNANLLRRNYSWKMSRINHSYITFLA